MTRVTVLGCGMIGHVMAMDLADEFSVIAVDLNQSNLDHINDSRIQKMQGDLFNDNFLNQIIEQTDWFILAIPGFLGFKGLERLLEKGQKVVDISFFPENPFDLFETAKSNGGFAVVDCGVAPGFSHLAAGAYYPKGLRSFYCYVGGLPYHKIPPFNYKAPFSPIDVIEEYTRTARYKENGEIVSCDPLLMTEKFEFEGFNDLEAFISDGLRSLLYTLPNIQNSFEKTVRYEGHALLITQLKEAGFFGEEEIVINGNKISPLSFSEKLLLDQWKLDDDEDEFTAMRLILEGDFGSKTIDIFDKRDQQTGFSSMSRTTGFTATSTLRYLIGESVTSSGVFTPEELAMNYPVFEFVKNSLQEKGIKITEK